MLVRKIRSETHSFWSQFVSGEWLTPEFGRAVIVPAITLVGLFFAEVLFAPFLISGRGLSFIVFVPIWMSVKMGSRLTGMITALMAAIALQASAPEFTNKWAFVVNAVALMTITLVFYQIELKVADAKRQAATDPLTGLMTRRGFASEGAKALSRLRLAQESAAVVLFDCDKFKEINDQYGHMAGDEALRIVAKALKRSTNPDDIVARLGGDEFVVLLNGTDSIGANIFLSRARQLTLELGQGFPVPIRLSAGIALAPNDSSDLETLVDIADSKMFRNKRQLAGRAVVEGNPRRSTV